MLRTQFFAHYLPQHNKITTACLTYKLPVGNLRARKSPVMVLICLNWKCAEHLTSLLFRRMSRDFKDITVLEIGKNGSLMPKTGW